MMMMMILGFPALMISLFTVNGETDVTVPLPNNFEAPLKTVIDISALSQQLKANIQQEVQKSIQEAVKKVVKDTDDRLVELYQNLTSEIKNAVSSNTQRQKGPAFSAVFNSQSSFKLLGNDEVLKFDQVYFNRGGGYDPTSGIFTAPLSGTYLVTSTIRPYGTNLHCYLWHNSRSIGLVFGSGWNTGSILMALELVKGDRVFIKHPGVSDEKIQLGDTSMFSAVFLSE